MSEKHEVHIGTSFNNFAKVLPCFWTSRLCGVACLVQLLWSMSLFLELLCVLSITGKYGLIWLSHWNCPWKDLEFWFDKAVRTLVNNTCSCRNINFQGLCRISGFVSFTLLQIKTTQCPGDRDFNLAVDICLSIYTAGLRVWFEEPRKLTHHSNVFQITTYTYECQIIVHKDKNMKWYSFPCS